VVLRLPLELADKALKRKTPPRPNGTKQVKKLEDVKGHMAVCAKGDMRIEYRDFVQPGSDVVTVCIGVVDGHGTKAGDMNGGDKIHGVIQSASQLPGDDR
jgi:hypothetical protein